MRTPLLKVAATAMRRPGSPAAAAAPVAPPLPRLTAVAPPPRTTASPLPPATTLPQLAAPTLVNPLAWWAALPVERRSRTQVLGAAFLSFITANMARGGEGAEAGACVFVCIVCVRAAHGGSSSPPPRSLALAPCQHTYDSKHTTPISTKMLYV